MLQHSLGIGRVAGAGTPGSHIGEAGKTVGPLSTQGDVLPSVMSSAVGWGGGSRLGGCPGSQPAPGRAGDLAKEPVHPPRMSVCAQQGCSQSWARDRG